MWSYPIRKRKRYILQRGSSSKWFSNEMNNFRFNQFEKLIKFYNYKKKIIEVGCGKGEYLSIIDTMDVDAYGIEFSLESVENCKNKG